MGSVQPHQFHLGRPHDQNNDLWEDHLILISIKNELIDSNVTFFLTTKGIQGGVAR